MDTKNTLNAMVLEDYTSDIEDMEYTHELIELLRSRLIENDVDIDHIPKITPKTTDQETRAILNILKIKNARILPSYYPELNKGLPISKFYDSRDSIEILKERCNELSRRLPDLGFKVDPLDNTIRSHKYLV